MAGFSSIKSVSFYNSETNNFKTFFARSLDIQITDHDLISNYIILLFNKYTTRNFDNQRLCDSNKLNFGNLKPKILASKRRIPGEWSDTITIDIDSWLIITLALTRQVLFFC